MQLADIEALIKAVCPIDGINSDGMIWYGAGATAAQKAAAQNVMATNLPLLGPMPDANGFAQAVKTGMGGILAANALMAAYPAFFPAIQTQAWADMQALVIDAKTKSVITTAQYNSIKAAAAQFNIPVTLP